MAHQAVGEGNSRGEGEGEEGDPPNWVSSLVGKVGVAYPGAQEVQALVQWLASREFVMSSR